MTQHMQSESTTSAFSFSWWQVQLVLVWHPHPPVPQWCPIVCSHVSSIFSETLYNAHRPIPLHRSGVGGVRTDAPALYAWPGLWVIFQMRFWTLLRMHGDILCMALQMQICTKGDIATGAFFSSKPEAADTSSKSPPPQF